jgi:hypothetical protein
MNHTGMREPGDAQMLGNRRRVSPAGITAQRQYSSLTKFLTYLSAAWCGISLLGVGVVTTADFGSQIGQALIEPNRDSGEFLGRFFEAGVLGLFIVFASWVACGRFVLRVLPLNIQGRGRSVTVALCLALSSLPIFFLLVAIAALGMHMGENRGSQVFAVAISLVLSVFCASIIIGLLITRYRKPRSFLDRPFVLFLRRFSAFSDRAVIAMILKQAAYGVPVVFLTPTHSRPGDWDPYLVGFAGLKLRHPWASAPIVVRVRHEIWQEAAYELIQRAQTILFDTSDMSSALRVEAEMLDRAGRLPDTVCLRHLVPKASSDTTPLGAYRGLRTIEYTKSWARALPRMLIGFLIVLAAAGVFFAASLPFFDLLPGITNLLFPVAIAIAAIIYYCSAFVRPAIDRKAKCLAKNRKSCAFSEIYQLVVGVRASRRASS